MCSTADDLNGTGESLDPHAWAVRNGSPGALDVPIEEGVVSPPAHGSFAIQLVGPPSVEKRCASSQGTPIPVARKLRKSCDFCCQRKRKCDGDGLSSCSFCLSKGRDCHYSERKGTGSRRPCGSLLKRHARGVVNVDRSYNHGVEYLGVPTIFGSGGAVRFPLKRYVAMSRSFSGRRLRGFVLIHKCILGRQQVLCAYLGFKLELRELASQVQNMYISGSPTASPGGHGEVAKAMADHVTVKPYVRNARRCLADCFDQGTPEIARAYTAMAYLFNFLRDDKKSFHYEGLAKGIMDSLPQGEAPEDIADVLNRAGHTRVFHSTQSEGEELDSFCKQAMPEMKTPRVIHKGLMCHMLVEVDKQLTMSFMIDILGRDKMSGISLGEEGYDRSMGDGDYDGTMWTGLYEIETPSELGESSKNCIHKFVDDVLSLQGVADKCSEVKDGVGELMYDGMVAYMMAFIGDYAPALDRIIRCSKILIAFPGLCRFSTWFHMAHCLLAYLKACEAREEYEKLRQAYNSVLAPDCQPAPPVDEWRIEGFCSHVFCRFLDHRAPTFKPLESPKEPVPEEKLGIALEEQVPPCKPALPAIKPPLPAIKPPVKVEPDDAAAPLSSCRSSCRSSSFGSGGESFLDQEHDDDQVDVGIDLDSSTSFEGAPRRCRRSPSPLPAPNAMHMDASAKVPSPSRTLLPSLVLPPLKAAMRGVSVSAQDSDSTMAVCDERQSRFDSSPDDWNARPVPMVIPAFPDTNCDPNRGQHVSGSVESRKAHAAVHGDGPHAATVLLPGAECHERRVSRGPVADGDRDAGSIGGGLRRSGNAGRDRSKSWSGASGAASHEMDAESASKGCGWRGDKGRRGMAKEEEEAERQAMADVQTWFAILATQDAGGGVAATDKFAGCEDSMSSSCSGSICSDRGGDGEDGEDGDDEYLGGGVVSPAMAVPSLPQLQPKRSIVKVPPPRGGVGTAAAASSATPRRAHPCSFSGRSIGPRIPSMWM